MRQATVGIEIAAGVVMGALAGDWLDGRWGTAPWGCLFGFCLGIGAAIKAVCRVWRRAAAKPHEQPGP